MSEPLVGLIRAPQNGGPERFPCPPGSVVAVAIPGKWILYVAPDHAAYVDLLLEQIREWPVDGVRSLLSPGMPQITREHAKAELARRGVKP